MATQSTNYSTLERPFDSNLFRSEVSGAVSGSGSASYGSANGGGENIMGSMSQITSGSSVAGLTNDPDVGQPNVADNIQDMYIKNYIKSQNYIPGRSGFFFDGGKGKIYAVDGEFSGQLKSATGVFTGSLIAGEIHIPDITTANSYHVERNGDTYWGCNPTNWALNNENAVSYIKKNGDTKLGGNLTVSGTSHLINTVRLGNGIINGKITSQHTFGQGDSYINFNKTDFGYNTVGAIMGIDDSDQRPKLYLQGSNTHFAYNGVDVETQGTLIASTIFKCAIYTVAGLPVPETLVGYNSPSTII